ncbi:uncharacterized protein LOC134844400 isoform X2 [Symsagittifera roscoffensis]
MRTGDKTGNLFGFQVYTTKWHKNQPREEFSSLSFMLLSPSPLPPVVPTDPKLSPLKDMIMCIGLGTEINSTSPDVYVKLEMIPLKPNKHEPPLTHPQNPISLCTLDSLHLEKEGRCEVKKVELTPHTCEVQAKQKVEEVTPLMPSTNIQTERPDIDVSHTEEKGTDSNNFWQLVLCVPVWVVVLILAFILIISCALLAAFARGWRCKKIHGKDEEVNHGPNTEPLLEGTALAQSVRGNKAAQNLTDDPNSHNNPVHHDYDATYCRNQAPREGTNFSANTGHTNEANSAKSQKQFVKIEDRKDDTRTGAESLLLTGATGDGYSVAMENQADLIGNGVQPHHDQTKQRKRAAEASDSTLVDPTIQLRGETEIHATCNSQTNNQDQSQSESSL